MLKNIQPTIDGLFEIMNKMSQDEDSLLGYSSGFKEIDKKTSGLQKGQLIVVAGRPSIGKSCFVSNLAESAIFFEKIPTLFFSFETNAETIAMRMIASHGKVNYNHLRFAQMDTNEWSRVTGSILQLQDQNFSISDNPTLSLKDIGKQIAEFCRINQNALIIIDDIQRIKPLIGADGKNTRSDELTEISRFLKELALLYQIPIVIVSQLNRNLENRPNKRPVISDLRDCGAIEDNADLIMFIYRDEVYNKESKEAGTAEIIIGKQRNGPIGTVRLAFEGQYTRFSNLSPEYYAQYDDEE